MPASSLLSSPLTHVNLRFLHSPFKSGGTNFRFLEWDGITSSSGAIPVAYGRKLWLGNGGSERAMCLEGVDGGGAVLCKLGHFKQPTGQKVPGLNFADCSPLRRALNHSDRAAGQSRETPCSGLHVAKTPDHSKQNWISFVQSDSRCNVFLYPVVHFPKSPSDCCRLLSTCTRAT